MRCGIAGVSLAMLAHAYGCRCHIAMPDDAAEEKGRMLEALGKLCYAITAGSLLLFMAPLVGLASFSACLACSLDTGCSL